MHYTQTLLMCQNVNRFGLPTGEGAPQGLRGWGVRLKGSRGRVPLVGSDKVRGLFLPCRAWLGECRKASQSTSK
ncbi:hypothetical protein ABE42_30520 [Bacillus thuringiensis]|nr:hypothetical protein [Bacillus thuringiensis]MBG9583436.1 hypothetical protein [Bacillus thuringiensis]